MDRFLLEYHMKKNNDSQEKLSEALGLPQSSLSARINGHIDFRKRELDVICKRYHLTADEIKAIFFA